MIFEGLKDMPLEIVPEELYLIPHGKNNAFYGKKHLDESKQRMSEWHKNKELTQEHRDKISKSLTGVPFTDERKKNVSKALLKQKHAKYAKLHTFELNGEIITEYNTLMGLSRKYNIPKTTMSRRLKR